MASFLPNITDVFPEPALYRPDFSYIDTMLKRRQAMYDQGFQEIAGRYKYISRPVTNPLNANIRDKFISQAIDNLKNLSAMDLSQQQNVATASAVFDPFVKNRDVLGDMALTTHWDQQESIAESYRLRDGGKEFSQDNINYVRKQRQSFANDDPSSWNQYYSNRKSYTPYYNYREEVMKAMEKFQPSFNKSAVPDGNGYLITTENSSITKAEVTAYLSAVLSDKAKQQMHIEGSVRFGDNIDYVKGYNKKLEAQEKLYDNAVKAIEGKRLVEKNPERKEEYTKLLDQYKERLAEVQNEKNIFNEPGYIEKNLESLASKLYTAETLENIYSGFTRTKISTEVSADNTYLDKMKEAGLNRRHRESMNSEAANRKNDRLLKMVDLGLLTFDTDGNIVRIKDDPITLPTSEIKTGQGYQKHLEAIKNIENEKLQNANNLMKYYYEIHNEFRDKGIKMDDPRFIAAYEEFFNDQSRRIKNNPNDIQILPQFKVFDEKRQTIELKQSVIDERENKAMSIFKTDLKSVYEDINKAWGGDKVTVNLYDNKSKKYTQKTLNIDDIVKLFMNSKNRSYISTKDRNVLAADANTITIDLDGKRLKIIPGSTLGTTGTSSNKIKDAYDILAKNRSKISNISTQFNELFDTEYAKNETFMRPINEKDPIVIASLNSIQNSTNVDKNMIVLNGYNDNRVVFSFKKGVKTENLPSEEDLEAVGIKRLPASPDGNPQFMMSTGVVTPRTGYTGLSEKEQVIKELFEGVAIPTVQEPYKLYSTETGTLSVGNMRPIKVVKTGQWGQQDTYTVIDEMTGIHLTSSKPEYQIRTVEQLITLLKNFDQNPERVEEIILRSK